MNLIFTTQSGSLKMFNDLKLSLSKNSNIDKSGFYVSDAFSYHNFITKHKSFTNDNNKILKEWNIINQYLRIVLY